MKRMKLSWTLRLPNSGQKTKSCIIYQEEKNLISSGFYSSTVKIKESEKMYKYLDLARELKRYGGEVDSDINWGWCPRNGSLKALGKRQGKTEIKERIETIKSTAFLKSARILRRL